MVLVIVEWGYYSIRAPAPGRAIPAEGPQNGRVVGSRDISSLQSTIMYNNVRQEKGILGGRGATYVLRGGSKIATVKASAVVRYLPTQAQPITGLPLRVLKAARKGATDLGRILRFLPILQKYRCPHALKPLAALSQAPTWTKPLLLTPNEAQVDLANLLHGSSNRRHQDIDIARPPQRLPPRPPEHSIRRLPLLIDPLVNPPRELCAVCRAHTRSKTRSPLRLD